MDCACIVVMTLIARHKQEALRCAAERGISTWLHVTQTLGSKLEG